MTTSLPPGSAPLPARQPLQLPDLPSRAAIQQQLLNWFAETGRDLPWRKTRDPYHILVSEMMLQQTQVDRVRPKYEAFLAAFPTLADLAMAPTADVIKAWAGLGYNRRAVNLQRIARAITDGYGGTFPQEVAELQKLPGIGPYTAGALACFAFEQDVAFTDTNIRRVLLRAFVGPEIDPATLPDRELLTLAQQLVPSGQGWSWNQGIMELGALLCTAAAPTCWRCPLREQCKSYAAWRTADETLFNQDTDQDTDQAAAYPVADRPRAARKVAEQTSQPFVGSNRYYRGRLVKQLRALAPGETISLAQLGPRVKPEFDLVYQSSGVEEPDDISWLRGLVRGLVRDGLAELHDDQVCLPGT